MQKYGVRATQVINLLDEAEADPVKAMVLKDAQPLVLHREAKRYR
jgi:hypothetical protein